MSVEIRNLRADDKPYLRNICYVTSRGFDSEKAKDALYAMYCDYYVEHCEGTSFVGVDGDDKPVGYVFCAPDYEEYEANFKKEYSARLKKASPIRFFFNKVNSLLESRVAKEYPAHLHIDILPEAQRSGLGTRLMDRLFAELEARGVKGVFLCCGVDNEKGVSFYRKYGFKEYANRLGTITFVYKFKNNI